MKLNLKKYILFSLICLSTQFVFAQEKSVLNREQQKEISLRLNSFTQNISTISANFVQEKVLSFMDDKLIAKGRFWFSSPDKIRWEYTQPYPYIIIMSAGKMLVNDEGDQYSMDMKSNQLFNQMNSLITKSIQGKLLSEELDYEQVYYEDQVHYIVSFSPKDQQLKAYIAAIEIYFAKENGQVLALKMIEPAGDYTLIKFSERIENKTIDMHLFELK